MAISDPFARWNTKAKPASKRNFSHRTSLSDFWYHEEKCQRHFLVRDLKEIGTG